MILLVFSTYIQKQQKLSFVKCSLKVLCICCHWPSARWYTVAGVDILQTSRRRTCFLLLLLHVDRISVAAGENHKWLHSLINPTVTEHSWKTFKSRTRDLTRVAETVDFITGASAAPVLDSEKIIQIQIIIHSLLQNNQVSRPPGWRQTRQLWMYRHPN